MSENLEKLMPVIKIKNFPSRQRVLKDFKSFLTEKKLQEEYKIKNLNKTNKLLLFLSNSSAAYKFTEKFNEKILKNPNYHNSKCSLTFKRAEKLNNPIINDMKNNNSINKPKLYLKPNRRKNKAENKYLSKSVSSISDYEKKHWADIRDKACIIDNDSPYIDEMDKEYTEKIKYMKKWVDKKNFDIFVGKASSIRNSYKNEIKNYVIRTPSLPPLLHQFRKTQKNKWFGKKNFILY